ncbi:RAD52 motif-containing protein 1 isoform X1 [Alligator sinensis]|uniref:RAD52 motif-containing protein 1 n=1 Tax=Alligator sinensis TaxID=38654 RepID=A0A1U7RDC6_ALLSI|nr:RAD52 motif-containing protein 1 isoform X1 [Alligator sinensis]
MAEVLDFRVPAESSKTLLLCGLEPAGAEHSLYAAFSEFGLLYSVRVHKNAAIAQPGCYAIVKFYSARDASRAQQACKKQRLFQKSPLKVFICTKQRVFQQQVFALSSHKCQELANYYLGFNGWSSRIITLQNISGFDEEYEELGGLSQRQCLKYLCALEVTLPNYGICTRGIGLAEAQLENSQDSLEFVTKTGRVQKLAVGKALSSAFQKLLLIVLENGKVAVEYISGQEESIDSLTEEELKGLIQVNDLSLEHFNHEEDEEFACDLSLDEAHLL